MDAMERMLGLCSRLAVVEARLSGHRQGVGADKGSVEVVIDEGDEDERDTAEQVVRETIPVYAGSAPDRGSYPPAKTPLASVIWVLPLPFVAKNQKGCEFGIGAKRGEVLVCVRKGKKGKKRSNRSKVVK